jgi:hypothetical protein
MDDGVGFGQLHFAHATLAVPGTTAVKDCGGKAGFPRGREALEPGFQSSGAVNALRGASGHSKKGILRRPMVVNEVRTGSSQKGIRPFHQLNTPVATVLLLKKNFFAFAIRGTFARMIVWLDEEALILTKKRLNDGQITR